MFPEQGYRFNGHQLGEVRPVQPIIEQLSLAGLNRILYRCNQEEVDDGHGGGIYVIPNFGALTYCGLQGIIVSITVLV